MSDSAAVRIAMTMTQCWHPTPGGTARAAIGQARALTDLGGVELVGVGPWGLGPIGRSPRRGWRPPIPTRRLPAPQQILYETWHRWRLPPVQVVTGRVDVLHATNITIPPRRRRVPLVVSVHDLFPLSRPDQFTARGLAMLRRGIDIARAEADVVLCPSRATLDSCAEAGFDPDRLRVVPWGVETTPADPVTIPEVLERFAIHQPFALWVGTIEPRKNLAALVDAFSAVPPQLGGLVLAGPLGWHVDLESLLAPLGDRVRVLGFIDEADLVALNAAATVGVLPSSAEGFGFTALEAMAQGTPVIVSAGSASEELVADAGRVVSVGDARAWAEALTESFRDPEAAVALGARARERAGQFTWRRCAEATLDAYRSVASV